MNTLNDILLSSINDLRDNKINSKTANSIATLACKSIKLSVIDRILSIRERNSELKKDHIDLQYEKLEK